MKRRTFLGALGASLAACATPSVISSPSPTLSPSALPTASPTGTPAPTRPSPNWAALRSMLRGALVMSGDTGYDQARLLYNTRFDSIRPVAIARCADERDVQTCLRFARESGVPLRVRSGGHSYAGWSSGPGLVIDLRAMSAISITDDMVTVGAGAQLIDVYDALAARGRGIGAGSCPTVGVSGLTLGGGLGVLSRAWGLTCDQLTSARVVLADGSAVTCDATNEPDLFWALRGGGGSFGAVTSLTFATRPVRTLSLGTLNWSWVDAAEALSGWQIWMSGMPASIWSTLHLESGDVAGGVSVHAVDTGSAEAIAARLDALVSAVGRTPIYRESGALAYRDVMLLEAGCLRRTAGQCHLRGTTVDGVLERETYAARSIVAPGRLSEGAVGAAIDRVAGHKAAGTAILFDALGGEVARVPGDATAFPHRSAFAVVQLIASWRAGDPDAGSLEWLRTAHAALRPLIGNGAYANYTDADLVDWSAAYYGDNYPRLQRVKRNYDPDRIFDFPQAIVPA